MTEPNRLNRIFRLSELPQFVGLRRTQISELIKSEEFPKPVPLSDSGRAVAWLESDLLACHYGDLIDALHRTKIPKSMLRFDDGALAIRHTLEQKHLDLMQCEAVNRKLSAHIGKYDGLFARLCIVWHCVENVRKNLPPFVTENTARRVAAFLHEFLLPHAVAFNVAVLGVSDDHDRLTAVAGYILAHRLDTITNRDVQRGDRTMRNLAKKDIEKIFDQLDAFGWINRIPAGRPADPPRWEVNPQCHRLFQARAEKEASRRLSTREAIARATRKV
jgi:predicted DNA-binding transcriptional regulator AlpA